MFGAVDRRKIHGGEGDGWTVIRDERALVASLAGTAADIGLTSMSGNWL